MGSLFAHEAAALTSQGLSFARAVQAIGVQNDLAQANLVGKLEAAMAGSYAGVWFDATTAKLHVGVATTASRTLVAGIVERAGLAADVAVTPVHSTWVQLLAAQGRWDRKLNGLFARREAETALAPQHNAVTVTLSSSLPLPRRGALEHEAATANVNVLVSVVPPAQLSITRDFQSVACRPFARGAAFWDKPITSGVTIEPAVGRCTAGPLAIPRTGTKNSTFLLTAGHCFDSKGEIWFSSSRSGTKAEIGKSFEFFDDTKAILAIS
jgi:hypothetical protein